MENTIDDLAIPAFLKRTGPAKKIRDARWKKIAAEQCPNGDVWTAAKRWEFYNDPRAAGFEGLAKLAFGVHRYWVVEGRLWCRIAARDGKVRISMREWNLIKAKAREIV